MTLPWDDFRLVKAIADKGGLTHAAAHLGINHSTAFRRLAAVEAALDARLFERSRSGYVPTPAGLAMVEAADKMETDVARFGREVLGRTSTPSGELRITAPVGFVTDLLMPLLSRFRETYPDVRLDVVMAEEALNLSRRDADVAIRATSNPPANLVGRRLSGIAWAVYGRRDRLADDVYRTRWVTPGPQVADGRFIRFLRDRTDVREIALQLNAVTGLPEAVLAGIGVGLLPCYLGDRRPDLARLEEIEPAIASDLWLLTHPDLRYATRVRAFMDFMAQAMAPLRPAFEGRPAMTRPMAGTQGLSEE
jgi:DNA-binding transcriptional LysR family regulator